MRYVEELEAALDKERAALETAWTSLFVERAQLAEAALAGSVPTPGAAGQAMQTPAPALPAPGFARAGSAPSTAPTGGMPTFGSGYPPSAHGGSGGSGGVGGGSNGGYGQTPY